MSWVEDTSCRLALVAGASIQQAGDGYARGLGIAGPPSSVPMSSGGRGQTLERVPGRSWTTLLLAPVSRSRIEALVAIRRQPARSRACCSHQVEERSRPFLRPMKLRRPVAPAARSG
jgi:hypothetical protein